ncbi:hypothetical protein EDD16DRAFT_766558 [Pisolithus croceorrhizus]|nr:hypothetical protein EDD16DRAFT_766558 [Pisolithus croceorrhizus]KAI6128794.1 hypothetical protein EV401DRAFT_840923 [Pisolithus croceorrhizus]
MSRHSSREFIPDGVTRQRVSRIATGRHSKQTVAEQQGRTGGCHFRVSKRKSYLVEGKFVSPGPDGSSGTNDDTTDESEESTEEQPEQPKVGSKAARKVQFGVKSGRPKVDAKRTAHQDEQHGNVRDDSEEENMSLYDTGDQIRTHDVVDNDVAEEPTHSTRPRLPFLRRNVREGFKYRCKMLGVDPDENSPSKHPIAITHPCPPSDTEQPERVPATSKTTVQSWSCVMCDLHGVFNNRTVLHKHLSWDHPEIDVKWNTDYSELLLLKRDAPINLATARSAAVALPIIEEDIKRKFTSSTEKRPTPSVVGNFGPTARHPYIPESSDIYSCRPGGPRLYDILNALPLEPFGVLSWVVVDREEELFELDDVLDEDKVMLALWYRWIFLNRNKFIASYFNGTKAFVTENWKLIRQAAGVAALRTWLLVLCVNNFLLPLEVVSLMQYYQNLVGTDNASG